MHCYGVLGMGSIAQRHLANLRRLYPDAVIYSVSSSGNNKELSTNADFLISFDELLLKSPKFVIIASPAPYHVEAAQRLLDNGIRVLIEKPLADNYDTCKRLTTNDARGIDHLAAVGYCLRFLPAASIVKQYIDENKLGRIYNVFSNVGQFLPNWRKDKNYLDSVSARKSLGGGALLELSHELDYLQWFFGKLTPLYSMIRNSEELKLEVEDIADLVLEAEGGVIVNVHLDFIQKSTIRTFEVMAEHGRLHWDLLDNKISVFDSSGQSVIYYDKDYDKNQMYLNMLTAFSLPGTEQYQKLASVASSAELVYLIDRIKLKNEGAQP